MGSSAPGTGTGTGGNTGGGSGTDAGGNTGNTGGTGFIGTHLCEKLAEIPVRTTVLTRRRDQARHVQMLPMVDVAELRSYDSASLAPLLRTSITVAEPNSPPNSTRSPAP